MRPRVRAVSVLGIALLTAFANAATARAADSPVEPTAKPKSPYKPRVFFGGGVAAAFGTVDYVELAPMVGVRVVPRFDVGVQPFYRWMRDGSYSPSVSTTGYGATVFARATIVRGLFAEADYQYLSDEYVTAGGGTTRHSHDAFLAGAGYAVPVGGNVAFYTSLLYDFSYDSNDPYRSYDSPLRLQAGVSVLF